MNVASADASRVASGARRSGRPEPFGAFLRAQPMDEAATEVGKAAGARGLPALGADPAPLHAASASAVQRVAVAVDLIRSGDRARIEIGLPGGAAIQLESGREGVTLVIAAAPPLARAAAAELPALVAALRQRDIRVARAELRVTNGARRGKLAR